jgi:phosphohistidine phosphatase
MRLLVIRHAHAAPQTPQLQDADRPLTAEGERRFRAAARGLAQRVTPDVLLTSPLLRARQTAAIASAAWGDLAATPERALASGGVDGILSMLENQPPEATIAIVGHEPTVSTLVAQLTGAASSESLAFEPGTAALLELSSTARRSGRLLWVMTPAQAAALGGVGGSRGLPPASN